MSHKNKLILSIIIIVILGFTLWFIKNNNIDTNVSRQQEDYIKIIDIDKNDLSSIKIIEKNKRTKVIEFKDNKIYIDVPFFDQIDPYDFNPLIYSTTQLDAHREIEEDSNDLNKYGLKNPYGKIKITLKNNEEITILVGNKTASNEHYYIKKLKSNTIYTVDIYIINNFFIDLYSLRNRRIESIDINEFQQLIITKNDLVIEIVPKTNSDNNMVGTPLSKYKMIKPYNSLSVDSQFFFDMLEMLPLTYNIIDFIDSPNYKELGLDPPKGRIVLQDTNKKIDFLIGNEDIKGNYIVKLASSDHVFTISKNDLFFLEYAAFDFVNKFIFIPNIKTVDKIKINNITNEFNLDIKRYPNNDDKTEYSFNSKKIEEKKFKNLYKLIVGISIDAANSENRDLKDPLISIRYYLNTGERKIVDIKFYEFNRDFFIVSNIENNNFLVSKSKITRMINSLESSY